MNSFWNPEDKLSERRKWEEETIINWKNIRSSLVCVPSVPEYKGIRRYFKPIQKNINLVNHKN